MIYEIKRGSTVIAAITANGSQERVVMSIDRVAMSFTLPAPVVFKRGDKVTVYGQTYKMNRAANETQTADKLGYQYDLEFEALYYDLAKWQFKGLDGNNQLTISEVFVTGNAATIVDLIVRNANRADSGWTIGVVDDTDAQQYTYINQSLLSVLQDLASRNETEFWVDNKTIHLQKRQASTGITLEFGKGKGLYELYRGRTETSVINRLYVEGGTRNLPSGYGFTRLQLPLANRPYLQATIAPGEEIIEHTETFDNIFPSRIGSVTALGSDDLTFIDTTINFDLNPLKGTEVMSFVSGQLAGFADFKILSYNHSTKTIKIQRITDDKAYPDGVPNGASGLKAVVGDKYVLLGIEMPASYKTEAENKLLAAGQAYLNENKNDKLEYRASLTPIWVKQNTPNIQLGYTVKIKDTARAIDKTIRVSGYTRDLQEDALYTAFNLSDTISPSQYARQYAQQERILYAISTAGLLDPEQTRQNLFLNRLSENNGYLLLGNTKVKAGFADEANHALEADHALLADLAQNSIRWNGLLQPSYLTQAVRPQDEPKFKGTGSPLFVSGFSGFGWAVKEENGNINATFDNLTVRKEMNVYELVINQIRATNGSVWVSDAIKILSAELNESGLRWYCYIDTDSNRIGVPFLVDDIVRCQRWTGRNVKYYTARVTSIASGQFNLQILEGSGIPEAGDDVVRIGNATDLNRQGSLYLTASDINAPYLDVIDGVNSASLAGKTKVRLGKLDGIVSPVWGALSKNGIWTDRGYFENVFISGSINVTGGNASTKSYAEDQANLAKTGAISTAASDATSKANAAKSAAESAAKTYADAQDNLKQIQTKAYADGIVTAEEARAIADAEAKLAAAKSDATAKDNALKTLVQNYADSVALSQANIAKAVAISTASAEAQTKADTARTLAENAANAYTNSVQIGAVNLFSANPVNWIQGGYSGSGTTWDNALQWRSVFTKVNGNKSYRVKIHSIPSQISYVFLIETSGVMQPTTASRKDLLSSGELAFTTNAATTHICIYVYTNGASPSNSIISNIRIKFEEGDKFTSWSPTPSDVAILISDADAKAVTAQAAYNNLTLQLKPMAYESVVEFAKLGTTVVNGGYIKGDLLEVAYIKANIINAQYINSLAIEATTIKVSGVNKTGQQLIDGIQVGGVNLIPLSNFNDNKTGNVASYEYLSSSGATVTKLATYLRVTATGATVFLAKNIPDAPLNQELTLSARVRTNGAMSGFQLMISNTDGTEYGSSALVTGGWTTVTVTGIITSGTPRVYFRIIGANTGSYFDLEWVQLEKGNKATDYAPRPSDLADKLGIGSLPVNQVLIENGKIQANKIETNDLIARQFETTDKRLSLNKNDNALFQATHENGNLGVQIGTDNEGNAVIAIYNNIGVKTHELSSRGLIPVGSVPSSWVSVSLRSLGQTATTPNMATAQAVVLANIVAAGNYPVVTQSITGYLFNGGTVTADQQYNGYHTTQVKATNNWIPDGWYVFSNKILTAVYGQTNQWKFTMVRFVGGNIVGSNNSGVITWSN